MDAAVYRTRSQLVEDEAAPAVLKNAPLRWRLQMVNWPEMLRHAEDWANGFWAGAGAASLIVIVGAVMVLLARGI
jgi:hypothetical protein